MCNIGTTCGACRGSGYITAGACEACNGSGYIFFDNGTQPASNFFTHYGSKMTEQFKEGGGAIMKLSQEQRSKLEAYKGDSVLYHQYFDEFLKDRLAQLDEEFVKELMEHRRENGVDFFWNA